LGFHLLIHKIIPYWNKVRQEDASKKKVNKIDFNGNLTQANEHLIENGISNGRSNGLENVGSQNGQNNQTSRSTSSSRKSSWFDLRSIMFYYNTLMVAVNGFYFFWFAANVDFGRRFLDFHYPTEISIQYQYEIAMLNIYAWTKLLDLIDTIFLAWSGKTSHLSFLHLYHHTVVPILGWLAIRINPTIQFIFLFGLLNCLIHTIMYSYYALASFGPKFQKYLWWKKYITQLQIGQFIIYGIYVAALFKYQSGYPETLMNLLSTQPLVFFYMFFKFYLSTYDKKNKAKQQELISTQLKTTKIN